jgi:GNAT superfamily N-acetyltransferase
MLDVAKNEDITRLLELGRQMHAESRFALLPFDDSKVRGLFENLIGGAGIIFVYKREAEIVGFGLFSTGEIFFGHSLLAFELGVFILPEYRGGMGAVRIIGAARQWAIERGAVMLDLGITTGVTEDRSGRFYESMGAQRVGALFSMDLGGE